MFKTGLIVVGWLASLVIAFIAGDYFELNRTTIIPTQYGRFLSTPKVDALPNGRDLKLIEDFVYIDPDDNPWLAPKGRVVNGASIPQLFWSVTGGPFSGRYRNASIVHDIECEDRKRPHKDVHRMFYHACLAGGVPETEAKRLYWAVARFGPRWASEVRTKSIQFTNPAGELETFEINIPVSVQLPVEAPTDEDVAWAMEYFNDNSPPIEAIPNLERP